MILIIVLYIFSIICDVKRPLRIYYNISIFYVIRKAETMDNKEHNNAIFVKIGQRIQYYRQKANLTQEKLAEKIGLTPNHLSRIEMGRHNPYFETIMLAAKELDVPIDAFLEDVEDNDINTFLQLIKSDIAGMSKNQIEMIKKYIALVKEFDF